MVDNTVGWGKRLLAILSHPSIRNDLPLKRETIMATRERAIADISMVLASKRTFSHNAKEFLEIAFLQIKWILIAMFTGGKTTPPIYKDTFYALMNLIVEMIGADEFTKEFNTIITRMDAMTYPGIFEYWLQLEKGSIDVKIGNFFAISNEKDAQIILDNTTAKFIAWYEQYLEILKDPFFRKREQRRDQLTKLIGQLKSSEVGKEFIFDTLSSYMVDDFMFLLYQDYQKITSSTITNNFATDRVLMPLFRLGMEIDSQFFSKLQQDAIHTPGPVFYEHGRGYVYLEAFLETRISIYEDSLKTNIQCKMCGEEAKHTCGECEDHHYCSQVCQRLAWDTHQFDCGKKLRLQEIDNLASGAFSPKIPSKSTTNLEITWPNSTATATFGIYLVDTGDGLLEHYTAVSKMPETMAAIHKARSANVIYQEYAAQLASLDVHEGSADVPEFPPDMAELAEGIKTKMRQHTEKMDARIILMALLTHGDMDYYVSADILEHKRIHPFYVFLPHLYFALMTTIYMQATVSSLRIALEDAIRSAIHTYIPAPNALKVTGHFEQEESNLELTLPCAGRIRTNKIDALTAYMDEDPYPFFSMTLSVNEKSGPRGAEKILGTYKTPIAFVPLFEEEASVQTLKETTEENLRQLAEALNATEDIGKLLHALKTEGNLSIILHSSGAKKQDIEIAPFGDEGRMAMLESAKDSENLSHLLSFIEKKGELQNIIDTHLRQDPLLTSLKRERVAILAEMTKANDGSLISEAHFLALQRNLAGIVHQIRVRQDRIAEFEKFEHFLKSTPTDDFKFFFPHEPIPNFRGEFYFYLVLPNNATADYLYVKHPTGKGKEAEPEEPEDSNPRYAKERLRGLLESVVSAVVKNDRATEDFMAVSTKRFYSAALAITKPFSGRFAGITFKQVFADGIDPANSFFFSRNNYSFVTQTHLLEQLKSQQRLPKTYNAHTKAEVPLLAWALESETWWGNDRDFVINETSEKYGDKPLPMVLYMKDEENEISTPPVNQDKGKKLLFAYWQMELDNKAPAYSIEERQQRSLLHDVDYTDEDTALYLSPMTGDSSYLEYNVGVAITFVLTRSEEARERLVDFNNPANVTNPSWREINQLRKLKFGANSSTEQEKSLINYVNQLATLQKTDPPQFDLAKISSVPVTTIFTQLETIGVGRKNDAGISLPFRYPKLIKLLKSWKPISYRTNARILFHLLAEALMRMDRMPETELLETMARKELQAEAISMLVCNHLGIKSDPEWSQLMHEAIDEEGTFTERTFEEIVNQAQKLIEYGLRYYDTKLNKQVSGINHEYVPRYRVQPSIAKTATIEKNAIIFKGEAPKLTKEQKGQVEEALDVFEEQEQAEEDEDYGAGEINVPRKDIVPKKPNPMEEMDVDTPESPVAIIEDEEDVDFSDNENDDEDTLREARAFFGETKRKRTREKDLRSIEKRIEDLYALIATETDVVKYDNLAEEIRELEVQKEAAEKAKDERSKIVKFITKVHSDDDVPSEEGEDEEEEGENEEEEGEEDEDEDQRPGKKRKHPTGRSRIEKILKKRKIKCKICNKFMERATCTNYSSSSSGVTMICSKCC